MKISLFIIIAVLIYSCANDYQRPPTGGEEDKSPIEVGYSSLETGELNVDKDVEIEVKFSEFFKWSSREKGLEISPYSVKDNYQVDWGERSVIISFFDLPENQTILISFNRNLEDLRGNPLDDNHVIAFSTGDQLDSCELDCHLQYEIVGSSFKQVNSFNNYKLYLYDYQDVMDSTLSKADIKYYLGFNDEGKVNFKNLKEGKYLAIALKDDNRNNRLDLNRGELYATSYGPIDLIEGKKSEISFVTAIYDTIAPYIDNISTINSDLLEIKFSEPILNYSIDKVLIDSVEAKFDYLDMVDHNKANIFVKDSLKDYENISILFNSFVDKWGNIADSNLLKFTFMTDSVPGAQFGIKSTSPFKIAKDDTLTINYTTPAKKICNFYIDDGDTLISVDNHLIREDIKDRLPLKSLWDIDGEDLLIMCEGDTLLLKEFDISKPVGRGSILFESLPKLVNPLLLIKNIKSGEIKKAIDITSPLSLPLQAGNYTFSLIDDLNRNNLFDGGVDKNFMGEKAYFIGDTIEIRSNWETSGYQFKLEN